jgi:hypothetical protein
LLNYFDYLEIQASPERLIVDREAFSMVASSNIDAAKRPGKFEGSEQSGSIG